MKCVKRIFFGCLLLFCCLSFSTLLCCRTASATDLVGTGDMWIDSITYERGIYGSNGWGLYTPSAPSNVNDHTWSFSILSHTTTTALSRLYIAYKTGPSRAALINFQITYRLSGTSEPVIYHGLKFKNTTVMLSEQCFNSQGVAYTMGSTINQDFTCNYLVYIPAGRKSIDTAAGTYILTGPVGSSGTVAISIQPANFVELSNDHLSDNDKAWLEEHLPAGTSQADIESAIEDAREEEKEEYEEQQGDVSDGADAAGEEASQATSSLINNAKNIIETIRDTPASNCVIRIQRGNFDTGNIDLCAVPQTIRTMISTVIVIPVTIAALHIISSVVYTYLYAVRKEQE